MMTKWIGFLLYIGLIASGSFAFGKKPSCDRAFAPHLEYHQEKQDQKPSQAPKWIQFITQSADKITRRLSTHFLKANSVIRYKNPELNQIVKLAFAGDAEAQYKVGETYLTGKFKQDKLQPQPEKAAQWLLEAAEQGHMRAQALLSLMLFKEKGVENKPEEALEWLKKAAEQNHAESQMLLGLVYKQKGDIEKSLNLLTQSAEQNFSRAQLVLGQMLLEEKGVENKPEEALEWLKKAAEQNHAEAAFLLGKTLFEGQKVKQDYHKAFDWFVRAGDQGKHPEAMYYLGYMYEHGLSVAKNKSQSDVWYQRAVRKGSIKALIGMGQFHYKNKNFEQAERSLIDLAEQGYAEAQYIIGSIFHHGGPNVRQDTQEAIKWFDKAARQDHAEAQVILGSIWYENKKFQEAFDLWASAADISNHHEAQRLLAVLYELGQGVTQNKKEAFELYKKSAENGNKESQLKIALMYEQGIGVTQNKKESKKWHKEAGKANKATEQKPSQPSEQKSSFFSMDWLYKIFKKRK